ncbi:hypothetical protein PInf_007997 [Phytophthora infestans]|nr:hypothetical protein PInf_007997 [Phytophthora infestans]
MVDGQATSADTDSTPFPLGSRKRSTVERESAQRRAGVQRWRQTAQRIRRRGHRQEKAAGTPVATRRAAGAVWLREDAWLAMVQHALTRLPLACAGTVELCGVISHPNRQTARLKSKLLLQTKSLLRQIKRILNLTKSLLRQTKALLRPTTPSCTSVSTRTWEPRQPLLEDGFEEEIALVDRWKDSDVSEFDKFCKQDEFC